MKNLKFVLLVAISLSSGVSSAQNSLNEWMGDYAGDLILGFVNRPNDTIPVKFEFHEIAKDSCWTYRMHYESKKYGNMTKDYVIRVKTIGDNQNYILDELNGIVMELTLLNDCLYGFYEVMESNYVSTIRKVENGLFIELISSSRNYPLISSTIETQEEPGIEAKSFKPILHQSVLLKKNE